MTMPAQFPALQQRGLAKFIKLALDFSANETLDPRITFSRTSNATRTNAQGLIEYAPHNLLTYSENFDNASWVKSNATVTANAVVAPDGTITADKISYSGASTTPQQTVSSTTATYSFSAFVKKGNTSFCRLRLGTVAGGSGTSLSVHFNIDTGVVSAVGAATADFGAITASITQGANGFYRISITFTVLTATTSIAYSIIAAQVSGGGSSNGDEIYIWGAQLNIGSLQPYYTTSVKNLLGYSQNFENAAWTKSNSSIDATPVMGPLGFLGAEKLVENTVNGSHTITQTITVISGTKYTSSIYAKAGERSELILGVSVDILGPSTYSYAIFNLITGTARVFLGAPSYSITNVGGGWYRCSVTYTANVNGAGAGFQLQILNASGQNTYTGDGTSGIYIFGAQLSDSASLDPYVYNFGAAPTSTAYYGPRFDYDPVTLAPKGLLIEESRANLLTYSEQFDNVAWIKTDTTVTKNQIGFDGVANSACLLTEGSAGTASTYQSTTVSAGATVTWSVYVKRGNNSWFSLVIGGPSFTNGANAWFNIATGTVGVTSPRGSGTNISSAIQSIGSGWYRCSVTCTPDATYTTALAYLHCTAGNGTGAVVAGSTYIMQGAQLEAGSFPTSYIPTTTASVTRAADNASMVGTNFSSWYNQSEGTFYVESDCFGYATSGGAGNSLSVNNGTTANQTGVSQYTSMGYRIGYTSDATVSQCLLQTTAIPLPTNINKTIYAYATNNFAGSLNGAAVLTDIVGTVPSVNTMNIGSQLTTQQLNGHIQSFKFFSKRFLNTYLQSLTQ